jgi:hypothetical protein
MALRPYPRTIRLPHKHSAVHARSPSRASHTLLLLLNCEGIPLGSLVILHLHLLDDRGEVARVLGSQLSPNMSLPVMLYTYAG